MEITKKAKQQLTASPAIIDLQGIVKRFYIGKPNELEILHGIDLQVQEGQFVSIVGESGSGKSTLMNIIGALDQPTGGQYLLDGECVGNLKDKQLSEMDCIFLPISISGLIFCMIKSFHFLNVSQ